jgi:hypothetical protein
MKYFFLVALFSSLFLFWIFGDKERGFDVGALGKEEYTQETASSTFATTSAVSPTATSPEPEKVKVVSHITTPQDVRAIYMSSWVASTPSARKRRS